MSLVNPHPALKAAVPFNPMVDAWIGEEWVPARQPLKVPTLYVHSQWDQEDIYGAPAADAAMEAHDERNDSNFLVIGPCELPIAMDILRGRYRDDPSNPTPIPADRVIAYSLPLPHANHVFLPGHRIMVQIQSSWFPRYDRNPQTYVENIVFAKPADFVKPRQRVYRTPESASFVDLPVAP
jgi:predicted acyl esterase